MTSQIYSPNASELECTMLYINTLLAVGAAYRSGTEFPFDSSIREFVVRHHLDNCLIIERCCRFSGVFRRDFIAEVVKFSERFFGQRVPAWTAEDVNIYVAMIVALADQSSSVSDLPVAQPAKMLSLVETYLQRHINALILECCNLRALFYKQNALEHTNRLASYQDLSSAILLLNQEVSTYTGKEANQVFRDGLWSVLNCESRSHPDWSPVFSEIRNVLHGQGRVDGSVGPPTD